MEFQIQALVFVIEFGIWCVSMVSSHARVNLLHLKLDF